MHYLEKCGHCGMVLRRQGEHETEHQGRRLIFTRTLVGDRFLPSCSQGCANLLRAQRRGEMSNHFRE